MHSALKRNLKNSHGVRRRSVLDSLKNYDIVKSTSIDIMHTLFLGLNKLFFNYWFSPKYRNEKFSLCSRKSYIDSRLLRTRPPSLVTHSSISVENYNIWRAKEFMFFIFYYAIPVFYQIMPIDYFQNLISLIIALEYIFAPSIERNKLDLVQNLLLK